MGDGVGDGVGAGGATDSVRRGRREGRGVRSRGGLRVLAASGGIAVRVGAVANALGLSVAVAGAVVEGDPLGPKEPLVSRDDSEGDGAADPDPSAISGVDVGDDDPTASAKAATAPTRSRSATMTDVVIRRPSAPGGTRLDGGPADAAAPWAVA